ncbi:MAG: hypothetical protein RL292_130 [Candidatus Parcubacteria bacterium]
MAGVALLSVLFINTQTLVVFADAPVDPDVYTHYGSTVKDSYVDQNTVGVNYGTAAVLSVQSATTTNERTVIQYDLAFLSSSQEIQSAEIYVYQTSADASRTYGAYQIQNSWTEAGVNWTNKPAASTTPTGTVNINPGAHWVSFDVTEDIKKLANGVGSNNGWMIRDVTEDAEVGQSAHFHSKNYLGTTCELSPSPWGCKPYIKVVYKQYNGGIFGSVWNDANRDGIRDEAEQPAAGETISLTGPISTTTTTNETGMYYIPTGLPSGTYTVCLAGSNSTLHTYPASGVVCSNGSFGASVSILGSEGTALGPDFGVFHGGSVKVVIATNPTLTEDTFNFNLVKDSVVTSSYTFFSGQNEYVFTGVIPGDYSFTETIPSWWALGESSCAQGETAYASSSFPVSADVETVCTFSHIKKSSLTVTNYVEPVVGTYSFTLSTPSELGETMVFEPVVLGNAESHTFIGIIPGVYNLLEIVDGGPVGETAVCFIGDTIVDPRVGPITIPAGVNIQCTYNHGEFSVIQGNVFNDMNANGAQNEGDSSLSGWTVKLFKITEEIITTGEGESIISTPIAVITQIGSKITTGAGYVFGQLNPGIYKVCQEPQSGWTQSAPTTGEDCSGSIGYFVTLDFGNVITKHFGNFSKGSVMGVVFTDTDHNGTQDSGEVGLSGITVHLGSLTTSTDTNGQYHFVDVTPATYPITIDAPAASLYSIPTTGNYNLEVTSGGNFVHKNFGVYVLATTTDTGSGSGDNGSGNGGGNEGNTGGNTGGGETASTTPPTTDTSGGGSNGGGGNPPAANGPIVASFGGGLVNILNGIGGSLDDTTLPRVSTTAPVKTERSNNVANGSNSGSNSGSGVAYGNTEDTETPTLTDSPATTTEESADTTATSTDTATIQISLLHSECLEIGVIGTGCGFLFCSSSSVVYTILHDVRSKLLH